MTQPPDPSAQTILLSEVRAGLSGMQTSVQKLERAVQGDPEIGTPSLRSAVMHKLLPIFLILATSGAGAQFASRTSLPACLPSLKIVGAAAATFKVALSVSSACTSQVFRVRKSSTLNSKRKGAPWQPIKPQFGAWNLSRHSSSVPASELSSLNSWQWQYYDTQTRSWRPIHIRGDE